MLFVQFGIRRNHFRLHPDAEFQTKLIYFIHKIFQSARQFLFIHKPVSKTRTIIVAVSKPAIIHNQHLNTVLGCKFCNVEKFLRIKIKISGFPVVNQNRALLVAVFAADQMLAIEIMEISRHFSKALCGEGKCHFRCIKGFFAFQFPGKICRMNSHHRADTVKLALFQLRNKIAGINKMHGIYFAGGLCTG